jgi:hypothetical protein
MNQKLFEFYARQYEGELERKEKLRQASTLPVGLTAVVGGLIFYAFQVEKTAEVIPVLATILSFLAVSLLIGFFILSARFYIAVGYKWIPDADEWNTWHASLRAHHLQFPNTTPPKQVFQTELLNTYVRCAGFNKVENDRKSGLLHQMHQTILVAIGVAAIAAFLRLLHEHGQVLYQ